MIEAACPGPSARALRRLVAAPAGRAHAAAGTAGRCAATGAHRPRLQPDGHNPHAAPAFAFARRAAAAADLRDRDHLRRARGDGLQIDLGRIGFDLVSLGTDLVLRQGAAAARGRAVVGDRGPRLHRGRGHRRRAQPPSAAVAPLSPAALGGRRRASCSCSRISATPPRPRGGSGSAAHLAASLAALALAALMAMLGAYFTAGADRPAGAAQLNCRLR